MMTTFTIAMTVLSCVLLVAAGVGVGMLYAAHRAVHSAHVRQKLMRAWNHNGVTLESDTGEAIDKIEAIAHTVTDRLEDFQTAYTSGDIKRATDIQVGTYKMLDEIEKGMPDMVPVSHLCAGHGLSHFPAEIRSVHEQIAGQHTMQGLMDSIFGGNPNKKHFRFD